jgi:hypothetical protein
VKKINLEWTNAIDVHCPTYEPNLAHVESLGRGNLVKWAKETYCRLLKWALEGQMEDETLV